jgi:hypothetical protein
MRQVDGNSLQIMVIDTLLSFFVDINFILVTINFNFLHFLMHASLLESMLNGFEVWNGIIEICFSFY